MKKSKNSYRKKSPAGTAVPQPFFAFLSINSNFSLGLLWKDFHKKPSEVNAEPA